ncbi:Ribosomal RNA small subunit methyltransferase E [Paramagnetospirillum magnetotacticum MS-1]|uniref:Ribosomal RNA small subunit methyltransferase E n=1 Tax=Paramagnetospirillum magnetotacticum MS-1 TaxID=272627 RepID=A0A0C2YTV7_PARME|nr:16S rRNA (uracil(1498)-N(3))-methyltransferase [Paramagnetospirillum magnetotacticum]KIL98115.1 Ribosomal RNA small subunit methyltransferase E [Paramagnetospirillum magnetotacticum MS-1]
MSDTTSRPRFRLFVDAPLSEGVAVALTRDQTHYLASVMRAELGEMVLLFNGTDGEWAARIAALPKAGAALVPERQTRPQAPEPDLWLLAAPLKKDRTDLVVEKAAELGVSLLMPVFTRRTNAGRVNTDRLRAHLIEAAEQCERLSVPQLSEPCPLDKVLADWPTDRILLFLDEGGSGIPLAHVLNGMPGEKLALLVGPEGGFDAEERRLIGSKSFARAVGLGPRILRAETAAIAALAVVQALTGDWQAPPRSSP